MLAALVGADDAEVVVAHLHGQALHDVVGVQPVHAPFQPLQQIVQLLQPVGQRLLVLMVGFFHAHRLAAAAGLHRSVVIAPGQMVEPLPETAEVVGQLQPGQLLQIAAGLDAQRGELVLGDPADAGNALHRQRGDEIVHLIRSDHEQPVGLAPVAGHLGQEFVRRHPGGHGDVDGLAHLAADRLGDARGAVGVQWALGDVEKGLVQGQGLDNIGEGAKNVLNLSGHAPVFIEVRR